MEEKDILALRKKTAEANTGKNGMVAYCEGKSVQFVPTLIFKQKIKAPLPDDFVPMSPEAAAIKYPSINRPQEIWTNVSGTVNFAYNWHQEKIDELQVPQINQQVISSYKKLFSNYEFIDYKVEHYKDKHENRCLLSWFDFISPTLTVSVYNIIAIMRVDGRPLQCIFNSAKDEAEFWKPLALQSFSNTCMR